MLIPDLRGSWDALDAIIEAAPDVLNHNTETVPRLYSRVRPGARYERTLELLARSARAGPAPPRAASWSGLGETLAGDRTGPRRPGLGGLRPGDRRPVPAALGRPPAGRALLRAGRVPGDRRRRAASAGLAHVEAGPLVRSSFEADRVAEEALAPV